MFTNYIFVICLFISFPVLTAFAQPQITIDPYLSDQVTQVGNNIVVKINLDNPTNYTLEGFDMQIKQTGFSITQSKNWPEKIEAGANLTGVYTLEAVSSGQQKIGAIASYSWNDGNKSRQGYVESSIKSIQVNWWPSKLNDTVTGGIITILGGILGAGVTGLASFIRGRIEEKKQQKIEEAKKVSDMKEKHEKTKSLLLSELDYNEYRIENGIGGVLTNWQSIQREGLYTILSKELSLAKETIQFYAKLEKYSNLVLQGTATKNDSVEIKNNLNTLKASIENWKFKP